MDAVLRLKSVLYATENEKGNTITGETRQEAAKNDNWENARYRQSLTE